MSTITLSPETLSNNETSKSITPLNQMNVNDNGMAPNLSHESTSSGENLQRSISNELSSSTENLLDQTTKAPSVKVSIPEIALPSLKQIGVSGDATTTIICREWKTESLTIPQEPSPALSSTIPEKDAVLWLIKDFSAFRNAAQVSQIPPLVSPEFGGGCRLRLWLFEKKGHIVGTVELPMVKASRDGVAHFRISIVRPDLKRITLRKVEMRITGSSDKKLVSQQRTSSTFRLTKARCLRPPRYEKLVIGDCLRVRVEFEYFPFDAPIFRGFGRTGTATLHQQELEGVQQWNNRQRSCPLSLHSELLNDIRNYCKDDPTQNVEIRRDETVFNACRFLLCARSKRFREIFGVAAPLSARGSPSRFGPFRSSTPSASVSSITVQDMSCETLDQLLSFIHTDTCQWIDDRSTDVLKALDLFEAADLYCVDGLVHRMVEYLAERMDNENFIYMFDVAERCNVDEFKRTEYMDSLRGSQVATLMRVSTIAPSPRSLA